MCSLLVCYCSHPAVSVKRGFLYSPSARPTNTLSCSALAAYQKQPSRLELHSWTKETALALVSNHNFHRFLAADIMISSLMMCSLRLYMILMTCEKTHAHSHIHTYGIADGWRPMGQKASGSQHPSPSPCFYGDWICRALRGEDRKPWESQERAQFWRRSWGGQHWLLRRCWAGDP